MHSSADRTIIAIVDREIPRFRAISDSAAAQHPAPGTWCQKEILGHLIDSASNNHQRFVRVLLAGELQFPGYTQDAWVNTQQYAYEDWLALIDLWVALNRHLAHIIARMPQNKMTAPCRIGDHPAITLEALIADYIRHMEHHLRQITL